MRETATKPPVGVPKARLKTADDLRRYVARLINEARRGEVDPMLAGRLGYLCNILLGIIRDSDLETRLAALESAMEEQAR